MPCLVCWLLVCRPVTNWLHSWLVDWLGGGWLTGWVWLVDWLDGGWFTGWVVVG